VATPHTEAAPTETHVPSQIGPRLREQRERLGMSLREIARRIGVSASLISQIERDKVNPSVSTLWALARELGLNMGDLFDEETAPGDSRRHGAESTPVVTPEQRAVINLASGVIWERLTPERDPSVEFLRVTYDAGSESCPADSLITHGGREYAFVISGQLGVRVGFDEYYLEPGHSITFDATSPHRLWAIGDEPSRPSGWSSAARATAAFPRPRTRRRRVAPRRSAPCPRSGRRPSRRSSPSRRACSPA
jgi:transcriptional regulator with XRE-family HTH domain